ncbi:MAG: bacillithiol biosynthesis BshC [Acidobacteria bacterium]|nr:bacillithiol biosynthesis BshC [Acidobacteriota bacterium]
MNPLALDLVRGHESATRFFESGRETESPIVDRRAVADALKKSNDSFGHDVRNLVDAWKERRGRAVIAGQQVGFGGGPLYTLAKLASLLNLAQQGGRDGERIIPFFWMATEDHDFAEVANLTLQMGGRLRQFGTTASPTERLPVGGMTVPEDLRRAVMQATSLPAEGWLEPGCSFRESFARLIVSIAGGRVVLVDSLLPELRRSGSEMFTRAASRFDELQTAIESRSEEVERAGYRVQVRPSGGDRYTLFYEVGANGARRLLESGEDLKQLSIESPERISTAALMRPLLQDLVFEPAAFVGGPAEVAYYAQLGEVYRVLGIQRPRVMLRAHALLIPERFVQAMGRHGIEPEEWLDSPEAILSRRELKREAALAERIELLKSHVDRELESIRESILRVDSSLTRSLNRTSRRIDYHLDVLGRRGRRVISRTDSERFDAVQRFSNVVRPNGVVQDRIVGWLSHWLLWGNRTLESVVPHAEPGTDRLSIIGVS